MSKDVLEAILAACVPAITLALLWGVKLLTSYLDTKINTLKTTTNNDTLNEYIDIIYNNTITIVKGLNQTVVDDLKAASADGKLTKEDALKIKEDALNLLTSSLSTDITSTIDKVFGDSHKYLGLMIERVVNECKN